MLERQWLIGRKSIHLQNDFATTIQKSNTILLKSNTNRGISISEAPRLQGGACGALAGQYEGHIINFWKAVSS